MKKILVILSLLFCLGLNAQVEHMKFMGIDMNCDVNTFKEKLIQKGFSFQTELIGDNESSIVLTGKFSNEEAQLFVEYDNIKKLVYNVKICITCADKDIAENKYQYFKTGFSSKYSEHYCHEDTEQGTKNYGVLLLDKNKDAYGVILMDIKEHLVPECPEIATLLILYSDLKNKTLHENKIYEDL